MDSDYQLSKDEAVILVKEWSNKKDLTFGNYIEMMPSCILNIYDHFNMDAHILGITPGLNDDIAFNKNFTSEV